MTSLDLLDDLAAEAADLEQAVGGLDPTGWLQPSAAAGWSIAHQVGHLTWTDRLSTLALRRPQDFIGAVRGAVADPEAVVQAGAAEGVADAGSALLDRWRAGRRELLGALRDADPEVKVPWFGPPMKPASMATARIMETFAHGQDVYDVLGLDRPVTSRVRHVCHLGVRTRGFAFAVRDLAPPTAEIRVELTGPDATVWAWGDVVSGQSVRGPARDFALLVTQRRHRDDLALVADGPDADRWLSVAQAFAGPPGTGRARHA